MTTTDHRASTAEGPPLAAHHAVRIDPNQPDLKNAPLKQAAGGPAQGSSHQLEVRWAGSEHGFPFEYCNSIQMFAARNSTKGIA